MRAFSSRKMCLQPLSGRCRRLSVELVMDLADKNLEPACFSTFDFLIFAEDKMRFGIAKNENLAFFLPLLSPFIIFVTRR